ncbi:hypothetical protein MXB_1880 [Myxobolus squamalis]|nr:hypothetical protein MXB_1880 [Myxobolus squamalis]
MLEDQCDSEFLGNFNLKNKCEEDEFDEIIECNEKDIISTQTESWDVTWDTHLPDCTDFINNLKSI